MKVWIDDVRIPPKGYGIWVKNSRQALSLLKFAQFKGWEFEEVSFDHDLGGDDTSRPVVLWLCESGYWPNTAHVHSANPVGIEWLRGMIQRYAPEGTLK